MTPAFTVWDGRDGAGRRAWLERWEAWPEQETWAHPAYVDLDAGEDGEPRCAIWKSVEGSVLYPFVLRGVAGGTDIRTPYGYGGAFFWGSDRDKVEKAFWPAFDEWAASQGVVSEFDRLALFPDEILPYPGETEVKLENVVRKLDLPEEELWMDVEHKVRKNVKKARRSGLSVEVDRDGTRLDDFVDLYHGTMERRGAREEYHFRRGYFERLVRGLPGDFAFFHAIHEGRVVSTELVLVSTRSVYSFLGGTEAAAYPLRPNDLLKWEICLWAMAEGKDRFVLGGGHEPDDGVFRHKIAFAPHGRVPFLVGRRILRPDAYERLVKAREQEAGWGPRAGYFPLYRA